MQSFKQFTESSDSAESKIRSAAEKNVTKIGVDHPISVTHNGRTQHFHARIDKVNSSGKAPSVVHLHTISRGHMITGDERGWIKNNYSLDSKNNLKAVGMPKRVSDEESRDFHTAHNIEMKKD